MAPHLAQSLGWRPFLSDTRLMWLPHFGQNFIAGAGLVDEPNPV
jgi:hypothetical protein